MLNPKETVHEGKANPDQTQRLTTEAIQIPHIGLGGQKT